MKKIAYIELDTHAEIAGNFMGLMEDSDVFSVDYYFSKKIQNLLPINTKHEVFIVTPDTIHSILSNRIYDLIILGTVHRYFKTFHKIVTHFKSAIIVHNKNFAELSQVQILSKVYKKDSLYRLKLLFKEGLLLNSKIIQKSIKQLVLDSSLVSEKYELIPLYYTKFSEKSTEIKRTIVIPGTVSNDRRNYKHVFDVLRNLDKNYNTADKIRFVFLGKASNRELISLKNLEQELSHHEIIYFEKKLNQLEFDEWMLKAHLIWCPIQQKTEFFSTTEVYGVTKVSGNSGDAIKYGKMAIFPTYYPVNKSYIINETQDFFKHPNSIKDVDFEFNKTIIASELEKTLMSLM